MHPHAGRYGFPVILIHWILALLVPLLLGLGWYVQSLPPAAEPRAFLLELHVSLGLTSLILILLRGLLGMVSEPPPIPESHPQWFMTLSTTASWVIYLCLVLIALSGYLQAVFSQTPVRFWGVPLPLWGVRDPTLADLFWTFHGIVAFVLTGFLFIHVGLVVAGSLKGYGTASRMLPGGPYAHPSDAMPTSPAAVRLAQKLARSLRLFGWIEFWLQLALAFVSALLLLFATSGRLFSPMAAGLVDGMFWAAWAFAIVWLSILLAFYTTRAAAKIPASPDAYIGPGRKATFWFLAAGVLSGSAGLLASLAGVAASISLLVAKTVSQPPGIAITDPTRIIRALDVFILLVNFNLLMAHFIGTAISLWLSLKASKSRLDYQNIPAEMGPNHEAKGLDPA